MPDSQSLLPENEASQSSTDPRQWVERHGDYLFRYALRSVRRSEVAEDLVQETMLAAWRARASFAGRSSERSWLTAILKRKVIDWLRATVREREKVSETSSDELAEELFNAMGKWRSYPKRWSDGTLDSDLTRKEFWAVVQSCTNKLPARLRDVFTLRHLEDESGEEICKAVDITPTNLWVMLHRARLRMWHCLNKNWYGQNSSNDKAGDT